jgi:hypothetical protein
MGWECSYDAFGLFTGLAKSEDNCVRHRTFGSDRQTNKRVCIKTDALKHVARTEQALDWNGLGRCPKPSFNVRGFAHCTKLHCVTSRQKADKNNAKKMEISTKIYVYSYIIWPYNSDKNNAQNSDISTKIDVYSYRRVHRRVSCSAGVICRGLIY